MRFLCLLMLASCGTLGGGSGGSENLPNRGLAPYEVKGPLIPSARSPSALVIGDRVRLYFEQDGAIKFVEGDGEMFGAATTVVEDGHSPAATLDDRGSIVLAYVDPTAAIVIAHEDGTVIDPGMSHGHGNDPSLLFDGAELVLYSEDGAIFRGDQQVFDHGRAPEVRRASTATGRSVYRMMYEGVDMDGMPVVAFAASFDGSTFSDFAQNPLLPGGEPSNVRLGDRYLLYYVDTGTIALAIDAPAAPSETF